MLGAPGVPIEGELRNADFVQECLCKQKKERFDGKMFDGGPK